MPAQTQSLVDQLAGAPQTLLIMLSAKADESRNPDGLFHDAKVLEIWDKIGHQLSHLKAGRMTRAGVVTRTVTFDRMLKECLARNPDATVVNLGAGLDTRFWRVDNGRLKWIDLDLPESMALRKDCFPETDRLKMLAGSVTDPAWLDQLGEPKQLIVVMEGLSMFLTATEMQQLLQRITDRYPGAEMIFDALSPAMVKGAGRFESFKETSGVWQWGIEGGDQIAAWDPRYQLCSEVSLFDAFPKRWGWVNWVRVFPRIARRFRPIVMHFRLGSTISNAKVA
ncbi:hypothetical protein GC163_23000 [bacterium]|nr:hypothetical protein [bacterium]